MRYAVLSTWLYPYMVIVVMMMTIVLMIMMMMIIVLMITLMMPTFLKSHSITRSTKKLPCSDQFALPAMEISTFFNETLKKTNLIKITRFDVRLLSALKSSKRRKM